MPVFLLIVSGIGIIALIIFLVVRHEKKRTEEFQGVAAELGLPFHPKGDASLLERLKDFHLFSQGHSKKMRNLLYGEIEGGEVALFGYQYTTGGGNSSQTHRQNVVYFSSPSLDLPRFALRPEHLFHKIGAVLGYEDIDFDSHEHFSKSYLLKGDDETEIRNTFSDAILSYFENQTGTCTEAGGDQLIFYRAGKRIKPVWRGVGCEGGSWLWLTQLTP